MKLENEWKYMEMEPCANLILEFYDTGEFGIKLSICTFVDLFGIWIMDENFVSSPPSYVVKFTLFGFSLVI